MHAACYSSYYKPFCNALQLVLKVNLFLIYCKLLILFWRFWPQDWTRATHIRLRLLKVKTLLADLLPLARQDPSVTRRVGLTFQQTSQYLPVHILSSKCHKDLMLISGLSQSIEEGGSIVGGGDSDQHCREAGWGHEVGGPIFTCSWHCYFWQPCHITPAAQNGKFSNIRLMITSKGKDFWNFYLFTRDSTMHYTGEPQNI